MKPLSAFLLAFLFIQTFVGAQDVLRIVGCTRVWKTPEPLYNTTIQINIKGQSYTASPSAGKHCVEMMIPVAGLSITEPVYVYAEKDSVGLEDQPINGLTMLDAGAINCHILGLQPFSSPYAMIAADINRSGSITTFDIVELQKAILGIYKQWPSNFVWRFLPEYVVFPDPVNPFKTNFLLDITLGKLKTYHNDTLNILGFKTGDVDADANTAGAYAGPTQYHPDTAYLTLPDVTIPADTTVQMPVSISAGLNGFQTELLVSQGLKMTMAIPPANVYMVNDSIVRLVAARHPGMLQTKFQLMFSTSAQAVKLRDVVRIGNGILPLGYVGCGNPVRAYKLKVKFDGTLSAPDPAAASLRATPATPNPFTDRALVKIELPDTLPTLLEVFGLDGRLLWSQEQVLGSGEQQLEIPAEALPPGSMGLYRIRAGAGVATGKVFRQ